MKKPYTNKTKKIQHIGPCTIWPGQTREIDETYLSNKKQEVDEGFKQTDLAKKIADILKLSVGKLVLALPALTDNELTEVEAGEKEKPTPRIGVINGIAAERVERASQSIDGDKSADEFAVLVTAMDDTELAEQDYPEESAFFVIVNNEKQSRAVATFKTEISDFNKEDLAVLREDYIEQPDYLTVIDEQLKSLQEGNA